MNEKSIVSPDDQGATFVELFFDLVFVFAITQVTHYAAHHLNAVGISRSLVMFWLIWWGWTQFTWALNAANTDHHHVRVGTLVSTGVAFAMAVFVEKAFLVETGEVLWFALSYIGVRLLGLGLYHKVVYANPEHRHAVATFASLSFAGLVAVFVGALVDPSIRIWLWVAAIAVDLGAARVAGNRRTWNLHSGHFSERHGLIVIIALGESLIVAGSALTSGANTALMMTGGVAVLITCLLWWTYFGWVREILEEKLIKLHDQERSMLASDAFTFWHFPLVCGIVALAVGFEGAFHVEDYTMVQITGAIGGGLALFLIATAGALWRAVGCILWNRLIVLVLTLGSLAVLPSTPLGALSFAAAGLIVIVGVEQITVRRRLQAD